ncbi:helix-turn-helix domain-containing protein [Robertmurraya kyonggiensis]|uniref:Uncharacterized protein n=1 Tax=Robertmurraya kyonggiensis TaxID=1037680 RepID=A0A4U1DCB0_9BACI|nr:helix-turn-helix domain-containing protein [Robertmurraya kyonggiensis]TKC19267.1 hypothetical protein FA727_06925 [Robertmurraya kyonggiensis]
MNRYLFSDINIDKEKLDRSKWPTVHEDSLEPKKRNTFLKRKDVIDMYLDGEKTIEEICETCGINHTDLYRLLKRCISEDENNSVYGYKALIPRYRIKPYTRQANINGFDEVTEKLTGAFMRLLDIYPNIKTQIHNLVFNKKKARPLNQ